MYIIDKNSWRGKTRGSILTSNIISSGCPNLLSCWRCGWIGLEATHTIRFCVCRKTISYRYCVWCDRLNWLQYNDFLNDIVIVCDVKRPPLPTHFLWRYIDFVRTSYQSWNNTVVFSFKITSNARNETSSTKACGLKTTHFTFIRWAVHLILPELNQMYQPGCEKL